MKRCIYLIMLVIVLSMLFSCKKGDSTNQLEELELSLLELNEGEKNGMDSEDTFDDEEKKEMPIFVHVAGAVNQPGVVELVGSRRVFEAVEMAGGLSGDAATNFINLARIVEDGERIYVPNLEEIQDLKDSLGNSNLFLDQFGDSNSSSQSSGKININQAGVDELMTLTGIGPSKARSIIDYREQHGGFNSIEELLNVSGIGTSTYERIKEQVMI